MEEQLKSFEELKEELTQKLHEVEKTIIELKLKIQKRKIDIPQELTTKLKEIQQKKYSYESYLETLKRNLDNIEGDIQECQSNIGIAQDQEDQVRRQIQNYIDSFFIT